MKKSIIFVDDEANVLDGLRRMLRDMRKEWKMEFAESGQEALDKLGKEHFDVIVSDMRMPAMDGAKLLTKVMETYPGMARIILSGQSQREMIYKSVGAAHQYLAKPCDPEVLKGTIERAYSFRALLADESLQEVVAKLDKLPSIPDLLIEITGELTSPDSSLTKVGDIISRDAGMTAKIMQMVNSAFFGFFSDISSPSQAVTLLGLDTVRALVISAHIFSGLNQNNFSDITIKNLWRHFFIVATVCREIVKLEIADSKMVDMAFMAGMLHDIGKIVLLSNLPEKYEKTIEIAKNENLNLKEAEQKVFNANHADVGGYLLGLWGLPDSIIEAIFFHHNPGSSQEKTFGLITAVHVANSLSAEQSPDYTIGELSCVDYAHLQKIGKSDRLDIWKTKCQEIIERVENEK